MNIRIATIKDSNEIYEIGKKSFIASHNKSSSEKDINAFIKMYYNPLSITQELKNPTNNYFIISQNSALLGFSNIELNCKNSSIPSQNSSKLDRIYFLEEAFGKGFGKILLKFNIDFSIKNEQEGIWLIHGQEIIEQLNSTKKMDLKSKEITIIKSQIPTQTLIILCI